MKKSTVLALLNLRAANEIKIDEQKAAAAAADLEMANAPATMSDEDYDNLIDAEKTARITITGLKGENEAISQRIKEIRKSHPETKEWMAEWMEAQPATAFQMIPTDFTAVQNNFQAKWDKF